MNINQNKHRNLKVVHIASGDLWAGAEMQLFTLAKQLNRSRDINLSIILMNHGKLERELLKNKIHAYVFDEQENNSLYIFYNIYRLLLTIRPDIIHTHRIKENIIGSIAGRLSGVNHSVRTTHSAPGHNPPIYKIWKHLYMITDRFCGKYLQSKLITVSHELAQTLSGIFNQNKIFVIENGVDIDDISSRIQTTCPLPGSPEAIKVGIVCRLVPVKRVDLFIEIAKNITDLYPGRIEFYIFGDGPLFSETKNRIKQLNIENSVYMMGFIENIPEYMQKLDLVLITSDHEGLPMNLLEAMSLHVPVISNNVGGIPDVLGHGAYGTLITPQASNGYTEALVKYITNPNDFIEKSKNGYNYLSKNYSAEGNANKYIHLYKSLDAIRND